MTCIATAWSFYCAPNIRTDRGGSGPGQQLEAHRAGDSPLRSRRDMGVVVDTAGHHIPARGLDHARAGRIEAASHLVDLAEPDADVRNPIGAVSRVEYMPAFEYDVKRRHR